MISLILLIFALVFFLIAALASPPENPWRPRLGFLGLASWVASELMKYPQLH